MRKRETRLLKIEQQAPRVLNGLGASPLPALQAFVDANGGRFTNESWAEAVARILDMSSLELMAHLRTRSTH